ncbi:HNH endonuclease signature motif containing protein [Mycobacterium sp. NPDC003449]
MESGVAERLIALRDAVESLCGLDFPGLTEAELLDVCAGAQEARNLVPVAEHRAIAALSEQTTPAKIGAKSWPEVMRIRLRISAEEAQRRYRDAIDFGPRRAVTGEALAPRRAVTAAAQAGGWLTPDHIKEMQKFFDKVPDWVDHGHRERLEEKLVGVAAADTPDALRQVIDEALYLLDQDGPEPVEGRCARRRGMTLGPQQPDGMSRFSGWLTPEGRATVEAVNAELAAPGKCNADDENPCISGTPSQQAIDNDTRTPAQRTHDALVAVHRDALMAGKLGQHNGLPVSIVVTTTLQELEAGTGVAVTRGGSKLPIPDLVRLAAHAWHYLAVFDKHTNIALHLGRTKRIATPGQRLVLFARDRGCTRPGCSAAGDRCQAHHAQQDFAAGGNTDIDDLALGCGPHQRMVGPGKWTTRINKHGRCEWIPPRLLDTGQNRVNGYHHPQSYLAESDDTADDAPG